MKDLPSTSVGTRRVAVIILNWQRPTETIACLTSLRAIEYPAYDVIVVDNGSEMGDPGRIRAQFPEITLIENGRNLGYAGGNNVGIAYALEHAADYVLLLNDDTEVASDLLTQLTSIADADPQIGMLGPTIYYYGLENVIWSAGGTVSRDGEPQHLDADQSDARAPSVVREIDYATGCALLVRREVIEQVGGLDERFFAYFEETEWCARARRAGFRVVHVPRGHVWHKITPGERSLSAPYLYLMTRNRFLYLRCRGADPGTLARAALQLFRTQLSWSLRPDRRPPGPLRRAPLRGFLDFMLGRFGAPPVRL
jgi:GT2 family glycosyltransferase